MPRNPDQPLEPTPPKPATPPPTPGPPPVAQFPSSVPLQPPRAPAAPAASPGIPQPGSSYGAQRAPATTYVPPPATPTPTPAAPPRNDIVGQGTAKGPAMPEFARPTGPSTGPTDFVNFSTYAGLNGDQLKGIADQAVQRSAGKQQEAMKLLTKAESEASADVPIEKTPSWQAYQDAMSAVNDQGDGLTTSMNGTFDGNYMEGALRGVYAPAQDARLAANWQTNQGKAKTYAQSANARIAAAVKARQDAANATVMAASQQRAADRRAAMAEQRSNGTEASPAGAPGDQQFNDSGGDTNNNRYRPRSNRGG